MSPKDIGFIVVFLAVGCVLGWHSHKTRSAHGDVKVTKGRIAGYRRTRLRSGLVALALAIVIFLIFRDAVG